MICSILARVNVRTESSQSELHRLVGRPVFALCKTLHTKWRTISYFKITLVSGQALPFSAGTCHRLATSRMTYFTDLHTYLHQSSLLIQAYPQTTRITTKYSLPKKVQSSTKTAQEPDRGVDNQGDSSKQKREPSARLTLKTFHPDSGICLKYQTDKAAEVGRLMNGLGKLAKGETIEKSTGDNTDLNTGGGIAIGGGATLSNGGPAQGDKMDVDSNTQPEAKTVAQMTQNQQQQPAGGKKKKKGKK